MVNVLEQRRHCSNVRACQAHQFQQRHIYLHTNLNESILCTVDMPRNTAVANYDQCLNEQASNDRIRPSAKGSRYILKLERDKMIRDRDIRNTLKWSHAPGVRADGTRVRTALEFSEPNTIVLLPPGGTRLDMMKASRLL